MDRVTTGVVATLVVGVVVAFVYALQPPAPTVATATFARVPEPSAFVPRAEPVTDVPRKASFLAGPKAPIARLSTDRDLFAAYRDLKQSNAGGDLHVARRILLTCRSFNWPGGTAREVAAGRPALPKGGALPKPVQIDAALDLLARCHDFAGLTALETQQALADMDGRLARADDPVGWGESILRQRRVLSDDQLRSMLASHDPVAIAFISPALADRWRRLAREPITSDEETESARTLEIETSFALASCDLGLDCGRDSLEMRQQCLYQLASCDLDMRVWLLKDAALDDRPEVRQQAALFVRAIQDDDFAFWGL